MKLFVNITGQKIVLLLSITTILLSACKREVDSPNPLIDDTEVALTAQRLSETEPSSAGSRVIADKADFSQNDAIGLYTQLRSRSEMSSTEVLQSDFLYSYGVPIWLPASATAKLQYSSQGPIYVFGYFPHTSMPDAPTSFGSDKLVVNYALPKEQVTKESLLIGDLMWVGSKNSGAGYERSREPINLIFTHKLTKVSFFIKLIDSRTDVNNDNSATLRSIKIMGKQIHLNASLNVLSGDISTRNKSTQDTVTWNAEKAGANVTLAVGSPAVHVTDMMLIPFDALLRDNKFEYNLYFANDGYDQDFSSYIPKYDPEAASGAPGSLNFASNAYNKITVTIDISKNYASLAASIEPWGPGAIIELPAERD